MPIRIVAEAADSPAGAEILAGLLAFNAAATGTPASRDILLLTLRDDAGALLGGLKGEIAMEWLLIDKLWIAAAARGQGQGAALLAQAENTARAKGAVGAHLYTSTFQAPGFYKRQGYNEIGRLQGRPKGHDRIWLAKRWA